MSEDKHNDKKKVIDARKTLFGIGIPFIILIMFLTDPDKGILNDVGFGSTTISTLIFLAQGVLGVGILYLCERAMFYLVDWMEVYRKAMQTENGPGMILIAISISLVAVAITLAAIWN